MKECKIIRDLLPNYIEKLTDKEPNQFIEEHLANCTECSKILEGMRSNINTDKSKQFIEETKYLKKYNRKLRTFKFIILTIILIFIINVIVKMIIISNMQNKLSQYKDVNNYYIKTNIIGTESIGTNEYWIKGNNYKLASHLLHGPEHGYELRKIEQYSNGEKYNMYYSRHIESENVDYKFAELDKKIRTNPIKFEEIAGQIFFLKTNNLWELFIMGLTSNISTEECNGKVCYKIEKLVPAAGYSISQMIFEHKFRIVYYIEKDTGLIIREIQKRGYGGNFENQDNVTDFEYEFNNVTDDVFVEPNLEEYTIKQN